MMPHMRGFDHHSVTRPTIVAWSKGHTSCREGMETRKVGEAEEEMIG